MSWVLVLWLLGAGGVFRETQSADSILEINKKLISEDDPVSSFLYEGDIVTLPTSKFDSKRSKWPLVNGTVQIPYNISDEYDEQQRNVIFEAFRDLENSTCIRFVERKNQQDYISILPRNGCYSNVGRCGHLQVVSLAFECIRRGKGVVLHELMHVIGFWHEHSRADRDEHVIIHYSEVIKGFSPNFCKFLTSNMIVPYDYDSLLHYSGNAFAKSNAPTIEPRNHSANIGQRIKLSKSDILRINKLYHCPQYVPSEDDKMEVVADLPSGGATCPEADVHDILSSSAIAFITSLMADSVSLEELSSGSLRPTESSKTSPDVPYSSGPGTTVSTTTEDSSVFMPETAEETGHQLQNIQVFKSISIVDSSVNCSELTSFDNTIVIKPVVVVETEEGPQTSIFMPETTDEETTHQLPNNQTSAVAITVGSSVNSSELDLSDHTETKAENQWSSSGSGEMLNVTPEQNQEYVKEMQQEAKAEDQWSSSGSDDMLNVTPKQDQEYIKEMQQEAKAEDQWSSSGSGEMLNVTPEQDQENLHIVRKRSLAWKTFSILSERYPRGIHDKLTLSYNNRRKSSEINKPFCGFEHGFCGWKQSTEDDLDWKLGWGSLNVNTRHFRPEGFHLTLKSSEGSVSGQKALLLRPIVQPSNCISFWYGSQHSVMGTLNVYITSSGREETLLWSSGGQDHVKWTKAQIILPLHLLSSNAYMVMEGVIGALGTSTIALDNLYVGQCSL